MPSASALLTGRRQKAGQGDKLYAGIIENGLVKLLRLSVGFLSRGIFNLLADVPSRLRPYLVHRNDLFHILLARDYRDSNQL
jgi:hypothetical protein